MILLLVPKFNAYTFCTYNQSASHEKFNVFTYYTNTIPSDDKKSHFPLWMFAEYFD